MTNQEQGHLVTNSGFEKKRKKKTALGMKTNRYQNRVAEHRVGVRPGLGSDQQTAVRTRVAAER